jgi:hypothetical protein
MILTLSLRIDPATVLGEARQVFSETELSEAFAATRGVTLPRELQQRIKDGHPGLVGWYRGQLAEHAPIPIQRWTPRRVSALIATTSLAVAAGYLLIVNVRLVGGLL